MVTFPSPIPGLSGKTLIDWTGAPFLLVAGLLAIWVWVLSRTERPSATFWLLVGLGLVYLTFDDIIGIHERAGRGFWTAGDSIPLGFKHFDDIIVLWYGLAGLAVVAYYRRELLRDRAVAIPFGLALLLSAVGAGFDATNPLDDYTQFVEEPAELLAAICFAVAMYRGFRFALHGRRKADPVERAGPVEAMRAPAAGSTPATSR